MTTTTQVALRRDGTALALPADLVAKAKKYASESRSQRTLQAYEQHWRKFAWWCNEYDCAALPANAQTIGIYLTWMADGQQGYQRPTTGRPWGDGYKLSISTITTSLAAIQFWHRLKGYPKKSTNEDGEPVTLGIDTKDPAIQAVLSGIRRNIAQTRAKRRVRPLTFDKLRAILAMLRKDVTRESRDAAVLALCCGAGLRRSELAGLDWQELGTEKDKNRIGYLKADEDGLTVVLMKSKASQEAAQDVVIPREDAPQLCRAVENWVERGGVKRGEPLFRGVHETGWSERAQSGYTGVTWAGKIPDKPWRAQMMVSGKAKHLGYFADAREASLAYCKAKGITAPKKPRPLVGVQRMAASLVARIVKRRLHALLTAQNKNTSKMQKLTKAEIDAVVAEHAGHSPRAGCVTSMAENGVPIYLIKLITRHKSDDMVGEYVRPVDQRKNWGLREVAF